MGLLMRYTDDEFTDAYMCTIDIDFKIQRLMVDDSQKVKLQIWDAPAGKERFRTVIPAFYRGAHALVFTFDLTDRQSFQAVSGWMKDAVSNSDCRVMCLVGNKMD